MGTKKHALSRQETVRDIYGSLYSVDEIKFAPQHGLRIHYGRLVSHQVSSRSIVMTPKLVEFIKETLDWKAKAFNLPFTYYTLLRFRRILQRNPYNSYNQWLENPKRPTYVTFDTSILRPEIIEDVDGQKFILSSAEMTELSIPILRGHKEYKFNNSIQGGPDIILTSELMKVLIDYQLKSNKLLALMPFSAGILSKLRRRLKRDTIQDVHGDSYVVLAVKAVPQHGINIYYGRSVTATDIRKQRIIMTLELMEFIKKTLDWKVKAFNLPFGRNSLGALRRLVQQSSYSSYKKWLADPKRPTYVIFKHASSTPEIIEDIDGQKFILYSAEMSALSVPVLHGHKCNDSVYRYQRYQTMILTSELRKVISDYRMQRKLLLTLMPFKSDALKHIRRRLGYDFALEKNNWMAERLDELITLSPLEFHKKYSNFISIGVAGTTSRNVRKMLAMRKKGGKVNDTLFTLLENYWLTETATARKELYQYFELIGQSNKFRRAYIVLKLAKRI